LNGAKNAGILAAQIIGAFDETVSGKIKNYKKGLSDEVMAKVDKLSKDQ
jgi:5-(carboxyamino)imidazole ribonucleotide mutase